MGRVEDVTLPARFLTTTAHLIATLTIVYDAVRARAEPHSARVPDPPLRAARPARRSRSTETETSDVPPSHWHRSRRRRGFAGARARRRGKSRHVSTTRVSDPPREPRFPRLRRRQEDTTRRALGSDQTDLAKWQSNLEGLAWTSLIFFAVEFAGMFTGVSLFMPTANAYYIFSHFFGALFVGLFVCLNWEIASYHWCFTLFSFFPALCEACLAFAVTQMNIMQYK